MIDRARRPRSLSGEQAIGLACAAALVFLAASFVVTRPPWSEGVQVSDVPLLRSYGEAVASGAMPYRDVAIEYPSGALAAFVAPALVTDDLDAYARAFAWLMRLCGVALIFAIAAAQHALGAGARQAAAGLSVVALAPLLIGRVALQRFDLMPAMLTAFAIALLLARRDRAAFAVLALGAGTKLFPLVVLPIFTAAVWQRAGRRAVLGCLLVFAMTCALLLAPFALTAPAGLADAFTQQVGRPLHRESSGGAILLALHQLVGMNLETVRSHGSQNFGGDAAGALAIVAVIAQAGVLIAIWCAAACKRMTPQRAVRLSAAAVVAFAVLGKVLSPQFLLWSLALVPLVAGRRGMYASALLGAALLATQAYFPRLYLSLEDLAAAPSWLIVVRDGLLLALLAVLLARGRTPVSSP